MRAFGLSAVACWIAAVLCFASAVGQYPATCQPKPPPSPLQPVDPYKCRELWRYVRELESDWREVVSEQNRLIELCQTRIVALQNGEHCIHRLSAEVKAEIVAAVLAEIEIANTPPVCPTVDIDQLAVTLAQHQKLQLALTRNIRQALEATMYVEVLPE